MISSATASLTASAATASATAQASAVSNALGGMGKRHMTEAQMDEASKDFESMFLSQMLEPMFGDSVGDQMFGDKESSDVYKGMMVEQFGKKIQASGGIGIASYVKNELMKLQEIQP